MTIKALVVENNPVLLRAISAILQQEGCSVKSASNGLDALNILKEYTPDIVFTDLVMPLVSGEQLCRIIRNTTHLDGTCLVVISAIAIEELERIEAEHFCDLLIAKGTLQEMRAGIKNGLNRVNNTLFQRNNTDQLEAHIPDGIQDSSVARELISERQHLQRILDNLAEGIVEVNAEGKIISLNGAALRILKKKEEQLVGSSINQLPWGKHKVRVQRWQEKHLRISSGDVLSIKEDDPIMLGDKVVTAHFAPVKGGELPFGLCILRDISRQYWAETHEKQLNDAVGLIAKMEAMSSMAGGIAHDFNNLLTVICGNLDMLSHLQTTSEPAGQIDLVDQARKAAYIAVDLTRKISSSSPFGIISRQKIVLNDLVLETIDIFRDKVFQGVTLISESQHSLVNVNPEQITVLLTNLLQNALEAESDDQIRVELHDIDLKEPGIISGQYVPAGEYVCLSVIDSGKGIAQDNLLSIFNPYFSTKARGAQKGVGLGLTVVYATVRNHGGYIVVESLERKGTTVSCYFPRYGQSNVGAAVGTEELSSCHVILVEEDRQMQEAGRIMLSYLGCKGEVVQDIDAAEQILIDSVADHRDNWLVLIDPEQQRSDDHKKLTERLMSTKGCRGVVATVSASLGMTLIDHKQLGYINILPKPYSLDNLRHVLSRTMRL